MARFHTLKVKDIRRETAESVSIAFEIPPQQQPEYQFKQGQYITLKLILDGKEERRSYSLCTSPFSEKELRVAVKEVPGGKVSTHINRNLKVGDILDVMTPMGNFHSILMGGASKNYVLIAGGSGITPMMSILKSVLYVEKKSTVTLLYANKNEAATIFKAEIDQLTATHPQLKVVYVFENPTGPLPDLQKGMITAQSGKALLEKAEGLNADEYFICGPGPMMENAKKVLEDLQVPKEKIHIEYFTSVIEAVNQAAAVTGGSSGC